METFMPRVSPAVATPDPSKHVNYSLGMVLGVDDFTQEFAYLSGRDQWLARDLIGYGTVNGLRVRIEEDDKGPRVLIEPGAALSPRGQLIRVTPAQCAYLNPWLAANKEKLDEHLDHVGSPPSDGLRLYVVLCYRDCATEMTPVPGEPCRSEDELMAASRLADDFRLELRFEPPDQQEEDALRDFVAWLSQVEISDTDATSLDDFIAAVRQAAHLDSPLSPPISSPPADFMFGSPDDLTIPTARACEYFRAAFRIWVTELRPLWRPNWFSEWQCCDQKSIANEQPREECLLLAELDVPVHRVALSGETKVDDLRDVIVNEERRPFLIHSRLLQEWLLCGRAAAQAPAALAPGGGSEFIVAAGKFGADGARVFSFGGLEVTRNSADLTLYLLTGRWFSRRGQFIVKATPITDLVDFSGQIFEVVQPPARLRGDDPRAEIMNSFSGRDARGGIIVRSRSMNPEVATSTGFTVEISSYPAA